MATLIENEPCYIYHVRDYQENSQILEAISLHYGALSIMVRGGKSQKSPTKGIFQPFTPLKLTLKPSRTDLYFLNGYEYCEEGYDFKMPYYFCAMYINELLHHLYHAKENDALLFGCYIETLEAINNKKDIETHLRHFELTLLASLGYTISPCDEFGHPLESNERYRFCFGFGFVKYDERLLRYCSSNTGKSYSSDLEDDGMLFSKSKVKGRRLESSSSALHMGYECFSEEQVELLQRYQEYAQEFLGPVLTGAQIDEIISLSLKRPEAARNAKLLIGAVIGRLLQGREIVSRRLYKEYTQIKAQKKAQTMKAQEQQAPAPQEQERTYKSAQASNSYSTPESYLQYAMQNGAQDSVAISERINSHYKSMSQEPAQVKASYHRYVAQFACKAAEANSDYEDIPEFEPTSHNLEVSSVQILSDVASVSEYKVPAFSIDQVEATTSVEINLSNNIDLLSSTSSITTTKTDTSKVKKSTSTKKKAAKAKSKSNKEKADSSKI